MKFNLVKTLIAIIVSSICAYALFSYQKTEHDYVLPICFFIESALILICALGLNIKWMRTMVNIKIISWIFFILSFLINAYFASYNYEISSFIVTNGILLSVFCLIVYSIISENNYNKNK